MIKIKNLSLKLDDIELFNKANINIPQNKLSVLIGQNGVGKTTLLKVICGIIKPQTIEIEKNEDNIFYLPQKIQYPTGITLQEYIESSFFKQNWKWFITKEEKEKINNTLELLELTNKKDTLIDCLSSGELQKANIALGLISNAKFLLLDEPTSNMDLINKIKTLEIIKKLTKENITCLIILHDLNLAGKYGDYFIGLTKNKKVIEEEKTKFFTQENLKELFGIDFKVINDEENFNIQILN